MSIYTSYHTPIYTIICKMMWFKLMLYINVCMPHVLYLYITCTLHISINTYTHTHIHAYTHTHIHT